MKTEEHYLRDLNLCMQVFNSEQGEKVCTICQTQKMVIFSDSASGNFGLKICVVLTQNKSFYAYKLQSLYVQIIIRRFICVLASFTQTQY